MQNNNTKEKTQKHQKLGITSYIKTYAKEDSLKNII